jgi:hypothetical protein
MIIFISSTMSAVCNLLFISSLYSMSHKGYSHSHLRYLICVLSIVFLAIFLSGSKYEIGSDTKLCSLSKLTVLNVVLKCMFMLNIWGTVITKTGITKLPSYELLQQWFSNFEPPPRRRCWSFEGGRVVCTRDIFIVDEIWAQDKIHILVGTLLG